MLKCSLFTRALTAKRQHDVDWTYIKTTENNDKNGQVKQPCCSQYKGGKKASGQHYSHNSLLHLASSAMRTP